ncbi:MAG: gamma-D-glutamyl-meso-diaminopimelate peptidase [Clostridia bacterium]|nr:gamma-D-glutamyl-meso-diaminopimelate peptidase [Clostridia bacterium]
MNSIYSRLQNEEYTKELCAQLVKIGAQSRIIGQSVMGREIPVLTLGTGKRRLLYLCGTHAAETVAGNVLLAFAYELLTQREICAISCRQALSKCTLHMIPLLNPDGAEIAQGRIRNEDRPRLLFFNEGNEDFSRWQANARGVDLNHNFDADFARGKLLEREHHIFGPSPTRYGGKEPFSEPETAAVRDFIEKEDIHALFAFHTQGEEIYHAGKGSGAMARIFAKACGYAVSAPEGIAACRGAKDWFCATYDRPGFTIEMGRGENPLPVQDSRAIYRKCREMLMLTTIIS